MNLSVLSWQSALLVKMFHQLENICSLLNWLSSRLLYGSDSVDLYRQADLQGHSHGHNPEIVQESFCHQTHQGHQYYFLSYINNAMEKAYYDAKLALFHYLIPQRLAIHPIFALLLHKDPSPNDLLFYAFLGNLFLCQNQVTWF